MLATVTVNTELDTVDFNDEFTSLREAIFATNLVTGSDTINFDFGHDGPASIVLKQGELAITDDLTIEGPGAELLTIDASGNDPTPDLNNGDGSRVFNIDDAQASSRIDVTITGLRLVGGDVAADGGAILNRENLTVANSVVEGNAAVAASPSGGGIYSATSLVIENSRILDNLADGRSTRGGGVAALDGLTIRNSEISGNRSVVGGVYSRSLLTSGTSIVDSTISGNSGGGLVMSSIGRPIEIVRTTIADNTSGMGLRITTRNEAAVLIRESTISGHTDGSGLGLTLYGGGTVTIRDSDFIGNVAKFNNGGGASIGAATGSVTIDRCNFIENTAPAGGGLFAVGNVQVSNSVFRSNVATGGFQAAGGGILIGGERGATSQVAIRNSVIEANSASSTGMNRGHGGGIFSHLRFDVVDSTVTGNSATGSGGGVYATVPGSTILRSTVRGNSAAEDGGGIAAKSGSRANGLLVTGSSIGMNKAGRDGGGLFADSDPVVISGSTIHENSAGRNGGGLRLHVDSAVTNSTLSGNRAGASGGGVWAISDTTLDHSTITENQALFAGGGAFTNFGSLALSHTIIASNTAPQGPDLHRGPNGPITADYSLIGDSEDSGLPSGSIETPDANGNRIGGGNFERINPMLGPLADNGGPTLTHALLPSSPAINAGNFNAEPGAEGVPQFDQRGEPFARVAGGRIDIGAFESQEASDLKLLVDTLDDESDGDHGRGELSLREAIELANVYQSHDTIRFDPALTAAGPATILLTMGELRITDDVAIDGPGAELLTVDASGNDPTPDLNNGDGSRVFRVSRPMVVSINALRLTGGDSGQNGGAILNEGRLTLVDVNLTGNASRILGGAIMNFGGNLNVLGGDIRNNSASDGGGILSTGTLVIENSVIAANWATTAGGGVASLGLLTITDSRILSNVAHSGGGGVFHARQGPSSSTLITRCEILDNTTTGPGSDGGGILKQGHMEIADSIIQGNSALDDGGGIYSDFGPVLISRTRIQDNEAGDRGGGVFHVENFQTSSLGIRISASTMSGNTAGGSGGGVYIFGNRATISDSEFSENSATDGGGLLVSGPSPRPAAGQAAGESMAAAAGILVPTPVVEIARSNFHRNSAQRSGGGIAIATSSAAQIVASTISGNTAGANGGGIARYHNVPFDEILTENTTISGNRADENGGGLFIETRVGGSVALVSTTIVENISDDDRISIGAGAGVFAVRGTMYLDHTIVAKNTDFSLVGPDLAGFLGALYVPGFSFIGTNFGSGLLPAPVGSKDANGNIIGDGDRIDPLLAPLADNGGSTRTHALLPDSPAINAGDPAARAGVDGVPLSDQRGAQFTRVYGGRIDIGAFERQPSEFLLGDFNRNKTVDAADLIVWRKANGRSDDLAAYVDARGNGDGVVDQWDYALWRANFGNSLSASSIEVSDGLAANPATDADAAAALPTNVASSGAVRRGKPAVRSPFDKTMSTVHSDALMALLAEDQFRPSVRAGHSASAPIVSIDSHTSEEALDLAISTSFRDLRVLSVDPI